MRALKEEVVLFPTDDVLAVDEYQHVIERALSQLNEDERQVIFLRFWEPLTIGQIADRLGIEWEEADYLIDRTVRKIQKEIKKYKKQTASA